MFYLYNVVNLIIIYPQVITIFYGCYKTSQMVGDYYYVYVYIYVWWFPEIGVPLNDSF